MSRRPRELIPRPVARGLSREEAAAYFGISPPLFQQGVDRGFFPKPKGIGRRLVWDRLALDVAFTALPDIDGNRSSIDAQEAEFEFRA